MATPPYVHWRDNQMWSGYLKAFPDYLTQGESIAELEANLRDIHEHLTAQLANSSPPPPQPNRPPLPITIE